VDIHVAVHGQANLLEVVQALDARCRRANLLDGGDQQRDQNRNDRDDDEQLDEREGGPMDGTHSRAHDAPLSGKKDCEAHCERMPANQLR